VLFFILWKAGYNDSASGSNCEAWNTEKEVEHLIKNCVKRGMLIKINKYVN